MNSLVIIGIVVAVVLAVGQKLLSGPRFRGWCGERMVAFCLQKLDPQRYCVLNDIYLPMPDGTTTQIDHITVVPTIPLARES